VAVAVLQQAAQLALDSELPVQAHWQSLTNDVVSLGLFVPELTLLIPP
jgi:hypothetical protein